MNELNRINIGNSSTNLNAIWLNIENLKSIHTKNRETQNWAINTAISVKNETKNAATLFYLLSVFTFLK